MGTLTPTSNSDLDKHLFTSSTGLVRVLLTQEADFHEHGEALILAYKTFLTRDALLTCITQVTASAALKISQDHVDVKNMDVARRLCQLLAWWIMYYPKDFDSDDSHENAAFLRSFQELLLTMAPHSELGDSLQALFYETVALRMETKNPKSTLNQTPSYSVEGLLKSVHTNTSPLTVVQLRAPPKSKAQHVRKDQEVPKPLTGAVRPQTAVPPTPTPVKPPENPVPATQDHPEPEKAQGIQGPSVTLPNSPPSESSAAAVSRLEGGDSGEQRRRGLSFSNLPRPPPHPSSRSRTPEPDARSRESSTSPPLFETPTRPRAATFSGTSTPVSQSSTSVASPLPVSPPSSPPIMAPIPMTSPFQSPLKPSRRSFTNLKNLAPPRIPIPFSIPTRKTFTNLSRKLPSVLQPRSLNHAPDKVNLAWFAWRYGAAAVAQQIALINFEMYFRVDPPEWAIEPYSWEIEEMNRWTGRLTKWVANEIIVPERIQERAQIYEIFVEIAEHLQKMNDYNGMVVVLNAMQVSAISRMKNTLKSVSTVALDKLNVLSSLIKVDERYKDLRQLIRLASLPGVPYPGIYVKELIYIRTGIPSFLDKQKTIINFTKVTSLTKTLRELTRFREAPYDFERIPEIQDYLRNWPLSHTQDSLFQLSLQREPREK